MRHHPELGKVYELDPKKMSEKNKNHEYCQCEEVIKKIMKTVPASFWFRFIFCPHCLSYWAFGPGIRTFRISARIVDGQKDSVVKMVLSDAFNQAMVA